MRILIAEDDRLGRRVLERSLRDWGHEVVECRDGNEALAALTCADPPPLAVLDWMMPGVDGLELCRRLRGLTDGSPRYTILVTARERPEDIVLGLDAGADDYLVKPYEHRVLKARIDAGIRVLTLQQALAGRVRELEVALGEVRTLRGLIPICAWCKQIRTSEGFYQSVEQYLAENTEAKFSHGICEACAKRMEETLEKR